MRDWGKNVEMSWFKLLDAMCVATQYHKELIVERLDLHSMNYAEINSIRSKIYVTGFPIYPKFVNGEDATQKVINKQNRVVFPHRLAPEKQPDQFDKLAWMQKTKANDALVASYSFLKTKEHNLSKDQYYFNLEHSKIAVSFALQETFGIAMLESVLCGCFPLVPDRLSYTELYPQEFKFPSCGDKDVEVAFAFAHLQKLIQGEQMYKMLLNPLQQKIINSGMNAIPNILNTCENT